MDHLCPTHRLTPAYAIAIMAFTCLIPYVSDGPTWTEQSVEYYQSCKKYWWTNLLYISNFYNSLEDQVVVVVVCWLLNVPATG